MNLMHNLCPGIRSPVNKGVKRVTEVEEMIHIIEMLEINSYYLFRRDQVSIEVNNSCKNCLVK